MYKYNPLLAGKLDRVDTGANELNDLDDVNTAGTVNDKVLTYQSGTWIPKAVAGVGDMLKAEYVSGHGTVYNASRLEGDTLATVQAHTVDAVNIAGTVADAHIPDLDTLSYGAAFATAQVPAIGAYKVASGTLNANRIPSLPTARITSGTFGLARIPAVDDARIPDLETLSYGAAFAVAQIPNLSASKITTGTFNLNRIPSVDDARIPDLETLSYGAAFAVAQIPNLAASKITSGTLAVARHETLDNLNGTVALSQIPTMDDAHVPDLETLSYGAAFATAQVPAIGAYKTASGTLAVARHETLDNLNGTVALSQIPTMDDAHVPDLETLSYGAAFATAQVPAIGAYKTGSGTFSSDRIPILPTDRYGSAVLLTGAQSIGGTKTFSDIPILPASDPTADNEAARKAYVDAQVEYHPYIGDETQLNTVSGTYQDIKNFHFVKHGSVVSPSTIRVACELKTTAGSYQMQIIVGGATAITFSGTQSTYTLRYDNYGLGAAASGVVETRSKLRNIGAGTSYNRLYDNYLRY